MKITKSFLKQLIKEELSRLEEFNNTSVPPTAMQQPVQQKPDPVQQKKQKDHLKNLLNQKKSDLLAAKSASNTISSLQSEIDEINKQLASMGG
jgi:hypothetical protein